MIAEHEITARPSNLERVLKCRASLFYGAFSDGETSESAELGTELHEQAARSITDYMLDTSCREPVAESEIVQDYVDEVLRHTSREAAGALKSPHTGELFGLRHSTSAEDFYGLEYPVELNAINPLFDAGTCDFWAYSKITGRLKVLDLKTGAGHIIEAVENKQLKAYAVALANEIQKTGLRKFDAPLKSRHAPMGVSEVELIIIQPLAWRGGAVKHWVSPINDVHNWEFDLVCLEAPRTDDEAALCAVVGEHCRWCTGAAVCPAAVCTIGSMLEVERDYLTPEGIADLLEKAETVAQLLADLKIRAKNMIVDGEAVPGWEIKTSTRNSEKWYDDLGMLPKLREFSKAGKFVINEKPRTPKQVRKELKEEFKKFEAFVEKKETEIETLVKVTTESEW
jgi:hypothetical protein